MSLAGKAIPDIPLYAFWDINKQNLDFNQDGDFIISRMFERGKLEDVLEIISFYGLQKSREVLMQNRYLSRQGLYFAHVLLNIPVEDFSAYVTLQHN
jgi:hypothetical protein